MKKVLLGLFILISSVFSETLLYENFFFNQSIEKTDLKGYSQTDGGKYKLGEGFVYEKDDVHLGKDVKKVLKFNKKGLLEIVFFYSKSNNIDTEDLLNSGIISEKNIKFGKGTISLNGQSKEFNINELKDFEKNLSEASLNFYQSMGASNILITSMFIQENKELKNEFISDNYTGLTKLKTCTIEEKHKDCVKCEYLEGMDKNVSCGNLWIYHPIAK